MSQMRRPRSFFGLAVRLTAILIVMTTESLAKPLFLPVVTYGSGGADPRSVVVADLNGDGIPDLVVANYGSNNVGVLLGNGDSTFQSAVSYGSGGVGPKSVAVADINGDGKPDLIVANCLPIGASGCGGPTPNGVVSVLLGNGNGSFQPAVSYDAGGRDADSVVVADVNGDRKPDVVVGTYFYYAGVLISDGDGTFQPVVTYDCSSNVTSVAVGDLDGDGKPDIAVKTNANWGLTSLLNNGDGTFWWREAWFSSGGFGNNLALKDVNRDGKLDVVVANYMGLNWTNGAVGVMPGIGWGEFNPAVLYDSGGSGAAAVAVADVNGDGITDILTANVGNSIGVLLGKGDGTYKAALTYRSGGSSTWVAVADVNGDGWGDLIVTTSAGVGVLLNNSAPNATTTVVTTSGSPSFIHQPVTSVAMVTSTYGPIPDGELVTFYDGLARLGSVVLASGKATYTTSSLSVKTHTIKATYVGNAMFQRSTGSVSQLVNKYPTATAMLSTPNPSNYGESVALAAHVTIISSTAPTGLVAFKNGTTALGAARVNGSGVATLTKTTLPLGSSSITATYNGDIINAKSTSSAVVQTVNQARITMTIKSWSKPSKQGQSVLFTATLTSNGGLPNGKMVAFSNNGNPLGTAKISGGKANLSITTLPVGSDVVTATYVGDANYSSATASVAQIVH